MLVYIKTGYRFANRTVQASSVDGVMEGEKMVNVIQIAREEFAIAR
jgi:hypothetical protein